jgi:hypothetical protein
VEINLQEFLLSDFLYQGGPQGIPPFLQFPLFCTSLSPNRIFRYARYFIFIDNDVQNSGNCKKGGMPWGPPWYKKSDNKNSCRLISTKNVTLKNRHIDITAPHFTNFYRQIFKIFKFMFFMDNAVVW